VVARVDGVDLVPVRFRAVRHKHLYTFMNESFNGTSPTQEETPEARNNRIFEGFNKEMLEMGLTPITIIQGSTARNIVALESGGALNRPFAVFEVSPDYDPEARLIYKSEVPSERGEGTDREVYFYSSILPQIQKELPNETRENIVFPLLSHVYQGPSRPKGILLSKLEGKILGTGDRAHLGILEERDLDLIVDLIRAVQKIDPATIDKSKVALPDLDYSVLERQRVEEKKEILREILGEGALLKIEKLLEESAAAQKNQPLYLLSEDVFTTNLMKLADGRLGSFDWERLHTGKNPADDYGKMVTRLWSEPELQSKIISKILEANQDIPGFQEMFRSNLISREGSHFLNHYHDILTTYAANPARVSAEQYEEAKAGKLAMQKLIMEAASGIGPWQK